MTREQRTSRIRRVRTLLLLILLELCFAVLIYRAFYIQCVCGAELRRRAEAQYYKEIKVKPERGGIYDRNLQPLAVNISSYSLCADPLYLKDREFVAESLSQILDLPKNHILKKLNSKKRFVWLKRKLSDDTVKRVRALEFSGLEFRNEERRFYPKGSLASHSIGFVGVDNIGLDGIEKACDSYMKGRGQEHEIQTDSLGRGLTPIEIGYDAPTKGYDVILTIDEVIQHIAETQLRQACRKSYAASGSIIIMNPLTGEILALGNYPTYDLNNAATVSDNCKRNRAIRDLYEPGSAFKIVTASAVFNEKLISLGEKINCENGIHRFDGYTVHDIGRHELLTFSEILEQSSNIGIVKVASRLGDRRLYEYIEAFGLTGKTGVELSERSGFVRPLESWTKHSMIAIPFGQEIAITPLQMLCSMNVIANDGIMMKPFIVQSIVNEDKTVMDFFPQEIRRPVSAKTARMMRNILTRAVENGTGKNARVYGYSVAGKTGTAQKASEKGGYEPGKYVSSFAGFISGRGMTISMIVVINEPQGKEHTGGTIACPVFREVATQVMQYLTIGQRSVSAELKPAG